MKTTLASLGLVVIAAVAGLMFFRPAEPVVEQAPITQVTASSTPAVEVPFKVIARGTDSVVDRRVNYIVSSEDELHELWQMITAKGKEPKVDFKTHLIAAVFAGTQPTAGYEISVAKVEDSDARTVIVQIAKPGDGCVAAQALIAPYQIIELPRTTLRFTHQDLATSTPCNK